MATETPQKLEENPLLPLDNQNLVYTLTRIFRQLAQIVNPLVAWVAVTKTWITSTTTWIASTTTWVADFAGFIVTHPNPTAGTTQVTIEPVPPNANASSALALRKSAPGAGNTNSIQGYTSVYIRWQIQPGDGVPETGANVGSNFGIYRYADNGALLAQALNINRANGNVDVYARLGATGDIAAGGSVTAVAGINSAAGITAVGRISTSSVGDLAAFYAPTGGVYVGHAYGVYVDGSHTSGSAAYVDLIRGNPAYGNCNYYLVHAFGSWAGHEWQVNGQGFRFRHDGWAEGPAGFRATSDARVKTNVVAIANALFKCSFITGYTYERLDLNDYAGVRLRMAGLIANQVQQVFPAAVYRAPVTEDDPDPKRSLAYDAITALLLTAINELHTKVKALDTRVTALDTRVTALNTERSNQIAALDARISALEGA